MTERARLPESLASAGPFPEGKAARPQADGDPDLAGDRRAGDVARTDAPENDGSSGSEDDVEARWSAANPSSSDPHHRGGRRF